MTYYNYKEADNLANRYIEKGGSVIAFSGGLVDNYILYGYKLKTTIIKEIYLNEWASGVTIRMYNKTPKKYQEIIEFSEAGENEKAENLFFK